MSAQDLSILETMCEQRQSCEVWQRVMGYHRPVSSWNKAKKQEFKDRTNYKAG